MAGEEVVLLDSERVDAWERHSLRVMNFESRMDSLGSLVVFDLYLHTNLRKELPCKHSIFVWG